MSGTPTAQLLRERFQRDPLFKFGVVLVAVVLAAAALAPWIAPHDPYLGDLANDSLAPPGGRFLFGADAQGRDVLSRVLYGARISLMVGVISQVVAVSLGLTLGLLAGYYRRWVDLLIMRLADITLAFPSLLLLIAVAAAVKPSLPVIFLVIGAVGWAGMARLVRGQVLLLGRSDFVTAARALGAGDRWILWRHLAPNVRAPVIISATLGIAGAIMAEAALSFVGLGAQPPTPSRGAMVAEGRALIRVAPWGSGGPGFAVGVAVSGFNRGADGGGGTRPDPGGAMGGRGAWISRGRGRVGIQSGGRWTARGAGSDNEEGWVSRFEELRRTEFAALDGQGVYLNSASIGPMPARSVALLAACNRDRARPGLWPVERLNTILAESRWLAARLINAAEDEIALMPNTTTGLNVAARALPLGAGDVVLTFDGEFPSNIYPWLARGGEGIVLERLPRTAEGWPDEARLHERLADPAVKAVVVSLTQFANGYTVDLAALSRATRAMGKWRTTARR